MLNRALPAILFAFLAGALLSGCSSAPQAGQATASLPAQTSLVSPTTAVPSPTPAPSATPAPPTLRLFLSPDLPATFLTQVRIPGDVIQVTEENDASLSAAPGATPTLSSWVYALAAPFPTVQDEISSTALIDLWQGAPVSADQPAHLLVDPSTYAIFQTLWGPPSARVVQLPADELLERAWQKHTDWALLPFDRLEPRWKVIAVDGQNPLHKDFDPSAYPLSVGIGLQGQPELVARLVEEYGPQSASPLFPASNRRADRLTTVVVTGVTALVRGTAAYMEQFGMDYPAQDILPWLRDADILHISNEIAFAEDCPSPDNWQGLAFCSQARYIQLLDDIGTDVIDLAGDHFADWGEEAMHFTLDLYRQRGWKVYGGGENIQQAKQPALFEHNGNKIAFLGCNYKNPAYSTAGPTTPGAVHCDPAWLEPEISQVRADGYLPIVTFQYEEYYEYPAEPAMVTDFGAAAQAGAVIVSGSQAHQPQALTFYDSSLIHYGLGNLFFDQVYSMDATRQAFIDRHVFYDGRHISTELLTTVFVDYARSRPATSQERQELLQTVFAASRWEVDSQVK